MSEVRNGKMCGNTVISTSLYLESINIKGQAERCL